MGERSAKSKPSLKGRKQHARFESLIVWLDPLIFPEHAIEQSITCTWGQDGPRPLVQSAISHLCDLPAQDPGPGRLRPEPIGGHGIRINIVELCVRQSTGVVTEQFLEISRAPPLSPRRPIAMCHQLEEGLACGRGHGDASGPIDPQPDGTGQGLLVTENMHDMSPVRRPGYPVLLLPVSVDAEAGMPTAPLGEPLPSLKEVTRAVIAACGLTNKVPAVFTAPEGSRLVVDTRINKIWVDGVEITGLRAGSHPFRLMEALARACPEGV